MSNAHLLSMHAWTDIYLDRLQKTCSSRQGDEDCSDGNIFIPMPVELHRQIGEHRWKEGFQYFLHSFDATTIVAIFYQYNDTRDTTPSSYEEFSLEWDGVSTVCRVLKHYSHVGTIDGREEYHSVTKYCRPWMKIKN